MTIVRHSPQPCPQCDGAGRITSYARSSHEGGPDIEVESCGICGGTGLIQWEIIERIRSELATEIARQKGIKGKYDWLDLPAHSENGRRSENTSLELIGGILASFFFVSGFIVGSCLFFWFWLVRKAYFGTSAEIGFGSSLVSFSLAAMFGLMVKSAEWLTRTKPRLKLEREWEKVRPFIAVKNKTTPSEASRGQRPCRTARSRTWVFF
jgi:hypothetical protein